MTVQRFLDAGLVTRLILNRVPVLIGTGISLFGPLRKDVGLEHVATREYAGGLVQTEYKVLPGRRTKARQRKVKAGSTRVARRAGR
jgi:dihydrofolate reductase